MPSSSSLTIDLSVIHNNLKKLVSSFGNVIVMVKANAYGTDPVLLSKFLQMWDLKGIPYVGVSHVHEGVRLREAGITLPIFVIAAPPYEAELAAAHRLTCAVSSFEEVERLNVAAKKYGQILPVHLHLDTGMNRFGASYEKGLRLHSAILNSSNLHLEGIKTHFVAAETGAFDPITNGQITRFKHFIDSLPTLPRWIHASNSAGAVRFALPFCNLARIGLGIIGCGPCLEGSNQALQFTTKVASIRTLNKGETVGYHCKYTNPKEKGLIGVIPVGYHDGLQRSISGKGYVLIGGKKAPMIGTICMDFTMIDLTDLPEVQVGDEVVLFGPELSPEILADWAQTDVRELLVHIPERVKRVWNNPPPMMSTRIEDGTCAERLPESLFPIEKDPTPR